MFLEQDFILNSTIFLEIKVTRKTFKFKEIKEKFEKLQKFDYKKIENFLTWRRFSICFVKNYR